MIQEAGSVRQGQDLDLGEDGVWSRSPHQEQHSRHRCNDDARALCRRRARHARTKQGPNPWSSPQDATPDPQNHQHQYQTLVLSMAVAPGELSTAARSDCGNAWYDLGEFFLNVCRRSPNASAKLLFPGFSLNTLVGINTS